MKLALYDDGEGSATHGEPHEVFLGDANSVLVRDPPMIWNGVKGLGQAPAMIAKCATCLMTRTRSAGSIRSTSGIPTRGR